MEDKAVYQKKEQPKGSELALLKKNITDSIMERMNPLIESKEIKLPANFSVGNAIHAAWFDLIDLKDSKGVPVLESCIRDSIANSLFKMCVWGLSSAKKQVAFIPFDGKLSCIPEYHGNMALAKRYGNVRTINAGVIYEKDVFEYALNTQTGRKNIIKHEQELENINDEKIRGAYCILTFDNGDEPYLEIMTFNQVKKAWMQGAMKGNSPAHKNFTSEMSKKTVISRACKLFFTSSDDAVLMDDEDEGEVDIPVKTRDENITAKSAKKTIKTDDVKFEEVDKVQQPLTPADAIPPEEEPVFMQPEAEPGY